MLKKKLANKLFLSFWVVFFLFFSSSFAHVDIKQGDDINDEFLSKIVIGMSKNDVLKIFGTPVLLSNLDEDCFCYYYYNLPIDKSSDIKYNYILMFFNESLLISYYFKI
ncbi:MAG TPA: outer membrane protein assembly factor BamE domain-containing protein [Candidatus Azoamicus sp.]